MGRLFGLGKSLITWHWNAGRISSTGAGQVWNFGAPADTSLRTALQCASYVLTGHYGYAPRIPHMEQNEQYYFGGEAMVATTADRHGFAIKVGPFPQEPSPPPSPLIADAQPNLFGLGMAMRNFRSHFNEEHVSKMVKLAMTSQSSCQRRLVRPRHQPTAHAFA